MKELRAISSTTHAMMKFPTPRGVATLVAQTTAIFECRQLEENQMFPERSPEKEILNSKKEPIKEEVLVNLTFLEQRITTVPKRIIQHSLNVSLSITPVAQKRRVLGPEKSKAVTKEVEEWVKACIVNMKLNPKKCSFGVKEGKFLGYMVTLEGIRANPKKTKAVAGMQSPKTLKEMQNLNEKLAALNRFLSRFTERALPFFETLKNITKENKDDY
ncbi:hypothetical protein Tco_0325020 [Tanacetum coccineum]